MQIDPKILKTDESVALSLRSVYRAAGYTRFKMSKFEEYALYIKNKDFLVSDGIISFTDTNGRLLALKPDVTLSIINSFSGNDTAKLYYDENVYRISKSSKSFKEIRQAGLECIGNIGMLEICEVLTLALKSLQCISNDFVFELSHIGLLEAVLEQYGLEENSKVILSLINQKNADELKKLELKSEAYNSLLVFIKNHCCFESAVLELENICKTEKAKTALAEFKALLEFLSGSGNSSNCKIDFSLANDMSYYSGVVFRGYIKGIPQGVLSGGQYDKLMEKMGKAASAIGFAVYLDTLERFNSQDEAFDVDVILISSNDTAADLKRSQELSCGGKSVRICREIPQNIRYREIVK